MGSHEAESSTTRGKGHYLSSEKRGKESFQLRHSCAARAKTFLLLYSTLAINSASKPFSRFSHPIRGSTPPSRCGVRCRLVSLIWYVVVRGCSLRSTARPQAILHSLAKDTVGFTTYIMFTQSLLRGSMERNGSFPRHPFQILPLPVKPQASFVFSHCHHVLH